METQTDIQVLLAAFNGEAWIAEQLESLLAQEGIPFSVLAYDDGSTDGTPQILRRYVQRFPEKIKLLDGTGGLGTQGAFDFLLSRSSAPYIAFCDQDDVWEPRKLRVLFAQFQTLENICGSETPILVHSDLSVVNEQLEPIHSSYWAYAGLDPIRNTPEKLLVANTVTGCALMANRALVNRAAPIPPDAAMHDHWLALTASVFGRIQPVPEPLVAYRQHRRNVIGACGYSRKGMVAKLIEKAGRASLSELQRQARAFCARYEEHLPPSRFEQINGFASLQDKNWAGRRLFLLRNGILKPGLLRNLGMLFCVRLADGNDQGGTR